MQLSNLIVFPIIALCYANAQELIKSKDIGSEYHKVDFAYHDEFKNQQSYGFFKTNEFGLQGQEEGRKRFEEGIRYFY